MVMWHVPPDPGEENPESRANKEGSNYHRRRVRVPREALRGHAGPPIERIPARTAVVPESPEVWLEGLMRRIEGQGSVRDFGRVAMEPPELPPAGESLI